MPSIISMPSSEIEALIDENVRTLSQLSHFVRKLSPEQYRKAFGALRRHSIGKHVRHIVDHYDALLEAIAESAPGQLDYERRKRDAVLEDWPQLAVQRIDEIDRRLQRLKQPPERGALRLAYRTDNEVLALGSSAGREVAFLTSHTIHHMAIIGLLAESLGLALHDSFGVHPSTLRHRHNETQKGAARRA